MPAYDLLADVKAYADGFRPLAGIEIILTACTVQVPSGHGWMFPTPCGD